jgi:tetraacyldisaccharide 4'-kinase
MNILEHIYLAGLRISRRMALGDVKRLPAFVVSIGNITVGGTGKTPAVIALALEVLKRGLRPCILTRGYGGSVAGPCFVSLGDGPLLTPSEAGDEPYLMALKLRGAEIIKGADRYRAGLLSKGADVFILDDGFQHRRLHRDMDVVLIDSTRGFGNGRLLPLGPLREPPGEIGRADIVALTRAAAPGVGLDAGSIPGESSRQERVRACLDGSKDPLQRIYRARHRAVNLIDAAGMTRPLEILSGADVFAFCGLANPGAFFSSVEDIGARIVGRMVFRDHYRYGPRDLKKITARARALGARWIITTEKDIIKTPAPGAASAVNDESQNMLALAVEFEIPGGFYDEIFKAARQGCPARLPGDDSETRR